MLECKLCPNPSVLMEEILKILAVLLLMIILIRFKLDVGIVLLIGAASLGLIFQQTIEQLGLAFWHGIVSWDTLELLSIVYGITYMGHLMKRLGMLGELTGSLTQLLKDARLVMMAIPALIGLMPMPGGALLSAPIVGEVTAKAKLSPERSTAINFWFRHIWEYTFPLYPGMLLVVSFLHIDIPTLMIAQSPLTLAALLAGVFVLFPGVPKRLPDEAQTDKTSNRHAWGGLLGALLPIAIVVVSSFVLKITLVVGLVVAIATVVVMRRAGWKDLFETFKSVFLRWELLVLILGVMIFSQVAKEAGVVDTLPETLRGYGVPALVIVFGVPFISAMITGITVAFIAMAYPLLMGYIMPEGVLNLPMAVWAFTGGFVGVLLSPVHLCLVLTRQHFGAKWGKTYALLVPMALILTACGLVCVLFGYPPSWIMG